MKYPGVYYIFNKISNKFYIGSSSRTIYSRIMEHKRLLRLNKHGNIRLQRSYNKYGIDSFIFEELEKCTPDKCLEREQYWINFHDSVNINKGYNIAPFAGSSLGQKRTRKQKQNISENRIGKCLGSNNIRYGKHWNENQKNHFREAMPHSKAIYQMDKEGNTLREFTSIREAASTLNIDKSPISKLCRNVPKHKTAYGFIWKFKNINNE